jgi:hypothetical protein
MCKWGYTSDHAQGNHSTGGLYKKGYMRHKYTTTGTVSFPSYAGQVISLEVAQPPLLSHKHNSAVQAYLDDVGFGLLVHVRVLLSKKNNT